MNGFNDLISFVFPFRGVQLELRMTAICATTMKAIKNSVVMLFFAGLASIGCVPSVRQPSQSTAATMSPCEVISSLIEEHDKGFERLRASHTNTPYGDIWKAKYDVVGSGCEIWRSGSGNTHYVCTRSAPDKATADIYYHEALSTVRGCLSANWEAVETPRQLAEGVKTTFKKSSENSAVIIHEIKTNGLFNEQWTIYYIIGEPNRNL